MVTYNRRANKDGRKPVSEWEATAGLDFCLFRSLFFSLSLGLIENLSAQAVRMGPSSRGDTCVVLNYRLLAMRRVVRCINAERLTTSWVSDQVLRGTTCYTPTP